MCSFYPDGHHWSDWYDDGMGGCRRNCACGASGTKGPNEDGGCR